MPYKVSKKRNDARLKTCGLWMPDGFYRVVDMTYSLKPGNVKQLNNLKEYGYLVEEVEQPAGAYTVEGDRPVDPESLMKWGYKEGPIVFLDEKPAELPKEAQGHQMKVDTQLENNELVELRAKLEEKGVKFRSDAKLPTLRKKWKEAERVSV